MRSLIITLKQAINTYSISGCTCLLLFWFYCNLYRYAIRIPAGFVECSNKCIQIKLFKYCCKKKKRRCLNIWLQFFRIRILFWKMIQTNNRTHIRIISTFFPLSVLTENILFLVLNKFYISRLFYTRFFKTTMLLTVFFFYQHPYFLVEKACCAYIMRVKTIKNRIVFRLFEYIIFRIYYSKVGIRLRFLKNDLPIYSNK